MYETMNVGANRYYTNFLSSKIRGIGIFFNYIDHWLYTHGNVLLTRGSLKPVFIIISICEAIYSYGIFMF